MSLIKDLLNLAMYGPDGNPESNAGDKVMSVKGMKKGGSVKSSASKRADGCCKKGKTKGRFV